MDTVAEAHALHDAVGALLAALERRTVTQLDRYRVHRGVAALVWLRTPLWDDDRDLLAAYNGLYDGAVALQSTDDLGDPAANAAAGTLMRALSARQELIAATRKGAAK